MSLSFIEIGKYNTLEVLKETDFGIYLGDEVEEILMPAKWVPDGTKVGDKLEVFIYNDSEDRIIATTLKPKIQLNQFAYLKVKQVTSVGAFLDWGLDKDLLVPFRQQVKRMETDQYYMVYMYIDEVTDRLVASSHINKFVEREDINLEPGQEVDLVVYEEFELGYNAIIDNKYRGLLYRNQVFGDLEFGKPLKGYIQNIREDKKIDLSLQRFGFGIQSIEPNADKIVKVLKENDGSLELHDKSAPEDIYAKLQMSKKNFKKAIGTLYKKKIIEIGEDSISLK
jgi:predicted RNA-binding protein (virulence factor B family)